MSSARLLLAYREGIFPWTVSPITWWSPDPRGILELDRFHISRSLEKLLRKEPFHIARDGAFREVMQGCAESRPGRRSTWISSEFVEAYTRLHSEGHAHSIECWSGQKLVGGIYGVALGGFFAGESMFYRVPNASKVALYHLVQHLRTRGFSLLDVQMLTPTTIGFGGQSIPRPEYLRRLRLALEQECRF